MPRRIKFEDFHQGEWPYPLDMGVGLSFEGIPNDYQIFLDILMNASCNPVSSRRILDILERNEIKYVTVMSLLDFNSIGHALAGIGVVMKIVPPFEYKDTNRPNDNDLIDRGVLEFVQDGTMDIKFNETDQLIFEQRLKDFTSSIANKPYNFGPYDRKKRNI